MEEWKDIIGFEGFYQVSNFGKVRNCVTGKILKPGLQGKGYYSVTLKRKGYKVHRLVAIAFIPNPNNLPIVNHKDENKLNNNADNLEWCDNRYNCNYGTGVERQLKTKQERGSIKFPELAGLALKDHKEYCKKWRELSGNIHPHKNLKVIGTKDGTDYEFEDTYVAAETIHPENKKSAGKNIEAAINGRRRSAYGYIWRYA